MSVRLYSDGSCHHTDQLGAYGAVVSTPTMKKLLWGLTCPTTVARMELTPMVEGLRWIWKNVYHGRPGGKVIVTSDSESTIKIASGFNEADKNLDLWAAFRDVEAHLQVSYEWRSRNSCIPLELCDSVAGALRSYGLDGIHKVMNRTTLDFDHES